MARPKKQRGTHPAQPDTHPKSPADDTTDLVATASTPPPEPSHPIELTVIEPITQAQIDQAQELLPFRPLPWLIRIFIVLTSVIGTAAVYQWLGLNKMSLLSAAASWAGVIQGAFAIAAASATTYAIAPHTPERLFRALGRISGWSRQRVISFALKLLTKWAPNGDELAGGFKGLVESLRDRHDRGIERGFVEEGIRLLTPFVEQQERLEDRLTELAVRDKQESEALRSKQEAARTNVADAAASLNETEIAAKDERAIAVAIKTAGEPRDD